MSLTAARQEARWPSSRLDAASVPRLLAATSTASTSRSSRGSRELAGRAPSATISRGQAQTSARSGKGSLRASSHASPRRGVGRPLLRGWRGDGRAQSLDGPLHRSISILSRLMHHAHSPPYAGAKHLCAGSTWAEDLDLASSNSLGGTTITARAQARPVKSPEVVYDV